MSLRGVVGANFNKQTLSWRLAWGLRVSSSFSAYASMWSGLAALLIVDAEHELFRNIAFVSNCKL